MIYFVSNRLELFNNEHYITCTVEESLQKLKSLRRIGLDTETSGLDCHTDKLLLLQLGCKEFLVVVDCTTVDISHYKELLESENHLFLGWNLKFDNKFLFKHNIIPRNEYDGFLGEKILWLGYPTGMHLAGLAPAAKTYLNITLNKSIRSKIGSLGITDEVIVYAAKDVEFLEDIVLKQREALKQKGLLGAIDLENKFLLPLSYTEYCGVFLDIDKWKSKMEEDKKLLLESKALCDKWLLDHITQGYYVRTEQVCIYEGNTVSLRDIDKNAISPEEYEQLKNSSYELKKKIDLSMFSNLVFIDRQGYLFDEEGNINKNPFDLTPKININWNSSKQVIPLFKQLGINIITKKKGKDSESIEAKVLKPQSYKCELINLYLQYKEYYKVTSAYGQNFLDQINPKTKRIHTNYNQIGTNTARVSSGGKDRQAKIEYINFLNLPRDSKTRACFIAEKGNKWISIDYSG